MHPSAATRYLHMQEPVVNDFVEYLDRKRDSQGNVAHLYEDLFKYTMEGMSVLETKNEKTKTKTNFLTVFYQGRELGES